MKIRSVLFMVIGLSFFVSPCFLSGNARASDTPTFTSEISDGFKLSNSNQIRIFATVSRAGQDPEATGTFTLSDGSETVSSGNCNYRPDSTNFDSNLGIWKTPFICSFNLPAAIVLNNPRIEFYFNFHGVQLSGPVIHLAPIVPVSKPETPKATPLPSLKYSYSEIEKPKLKLDGTLRMVYKIFSDSGNSLDPSKASLKVCLGQECKISSADSNLIISYQQKLNAVQVSRIPTDGLMITLSYDGISLDSGLINSYLDRETAPDPTTSLVATLSIPPAGKLGVPFYSTVGIKGKGSANCQIYTANSNNGGTSFSSNGWFSQRFKVKAGVSVRIKTLMTINSKGIYGVMASCTDAANGAPLAYVLNRMVQM
jgi:hypothetical protein